MQAGGGARATAPNGQTPCQKKVKPAPRSTQSRSTQALPQRSPAAGLGARSEGKKSPGADMLVNRLHYALPGWDDARCGREARGAVERASTNDESARRRGSLQVVSCVGFARSRLRRRRSLGPLDPSSIIHHPSSDHRIIGSSVIGRERERARACRLLTTCRAKPPFTHKKHRTPVGLVLEASTQTYT
jgi:hypothetical protein